MIDTQNEQPAGALDHTSPGGLRRLRLDISYDGTDFHGWARQPGLRTVQAELEAALRAVLRVPAETPVRVAVAGRTDAGVHAIGQVCHCDVPVGRGVSLLGQNSWARGRSRNDASSSVAGVPSGDDGEQPECSGSREKSRAPGRWNSQEATSGPEGGEGAPAQVAQVREAVAPIARRLNGVLPPDLRVRQLSVAAPGFDARWSAAWREYSYLLADDPADVDPRLRTHVVTSRPLDVAAMQAAARPFCGEHDFAAFCRAREDASTVRTILGLGWERRTPAGNGPGVVEFRIRSDAFCHSMVRALVGAFVAVGEGRWPVERPADLLAAAVRVPAIATAPARGLTLVAVGYPPDDELADQAQRARRWRGSEPRT